MAGTTEASLDRLAHHIAAQIERSSILSLSGEMDGVPPQTSSSSSSKNTAALLLQRVSSRAARGTSAERYTNQFNISCNF
jgi:hypothetical protein